MATTGGRPDAGLPDLLDSLSGQDWLAVSLAAASGLLHLVLYATATRLPSLVAGIGYVALAGLLVGLRARRRLVYPLGALFVVTQLLTSLGFPVAPVPVGYLDLALQGLLVLVLALQFSEDVASPPPDDSLPP